MQLLKERILRDGKVKEGNVLKVDSFLNHRMDISLMQEIGKEFRRRFPQPEINKILTIEASGIGIAAIAAQYFNNADVVFAKKTKSKNLDGELYTVQVFSFTRGVPFEVEVSKKYLDQDDCVLIIDDFLANGQALKGLMEIVRQSGARLAGCGIVIEKGFQDGGKLLREQGVNLQSLAIVDSIDNGAITFRE
jgi:xanthine phosphoribosyltransferase